MSNDGLEILRETVQRIKGGKSQATELIKNYSLEQALEAETKIIQWANQNGYDLENQQDHKIKNSEHFTRIHIYRYYLKPHIEALQTAENAKKILIDTTEATPEQLSLD